jgi:hypothetical protein
MKLNSAKSWLLFIVTGTAFVLLLAIIATFVLALRARAEAVTYIRLVTSLRIGTTYDAAAAQLRDAGISPNVPTDCRSACTLLFHFDNKWQSLLHLAPPAALSGQLDFRDDKVVSKTTAMSQSTYGAEVTESASRASRTSGDIDSSGRPRKVFVDLSAFDFTEYRKQAYAFDLACIGSMRGCKTDEFLPTVNELEHATPTLSEREHTTPSSISVHEFAAKSYTLEVLYRLAVKYHVVIGIYGTMLSADYKTIEISIKNGTLGDALDATTKADPQFEWHLSSNGAIHFVSRNAPLSLMDVMVHSFEIDSPQDFEILGRLQSVPAVQSWYQKRKCPMNYSIMGTGGDLTPWGNFSVHARDVPVSSILDEIAAKSHSYYWSFVQYGTDPCAMVLEWKDPQP